MYRSLYFIFVFFLICSCDTGEICEGFNFNRIPFTKKYYCRNLIYTNNKDTVNLLANDIEYTKQSSINSYSNPECDPLFTVSYDTKKGRYIDIIYTFRYNKNDTFTDLNVNLNSSRFNLKIYSNSIDKFYKVTGIEHLNKSDSNLMIKKVLVKNMKIVEFENLKGVKWKLINL